jgi:hypothetical protein
MRFLNDCFNFTISIFRIFASKAVVFNLDCVAGPEVLKRSLSVTKISNKLLANPKY